MSFRLLEGWHVLRAREVQYDDTTLHDAYMVARVTLRYSSGKPFHWFDTSELEDSVVIVADTKSEQTFSHR